MGGRLERAIKQQPFAAMAFATLLVSGNAVIAKLMFGYMPPLVWGFFRFSITAVIFILIAQAKFGTPEHLPLRKLRTNVLLAMVNAVAFFLGLELTQAINSSILSLLIPVMVYVGSVAFLREPYSSKALVGALISIIGGLLLFGSPSFDSSDSSEILGIGLLLISFISLAALILQTKVLYRSLEVEQVLGVRLMYTALALGLLAVLFGNPVILVPLDVAGWSLLLFGSFISSGLGMYIYYHSLKHMRAEESASIFYLDPLFAAFLSVLVLGDTLSQFALAASAVILMGVIVAHPVHIRRMHFYESPAFSIFDRFRHWVEDRIDDVTGLVKKFF